MDHPSDPLGAGDEVVSLPMAREAELVVLDGGTATTLQRAGHRLDGALWSARLLVDEPGAIVAVHDAFLAAGAQIVTTASYQLAEISLAAVGRNPADAGQLLTRSVDLARRAVTQHVERRGGPRPLVAASVGPYGAVLADGSEYRGGYHIREDELVSFHAPRVAALIEAGADVLACETVPSAVELAALAHVLQGTTTPTYVSVTLGPDGTTTAEGQGLREAFAPLLALDTVVAVGVNCCPPELVLPALEVLADVPLPLVVEPNVARRFDATQRRWIPAERGTDAGSVLPGTVDVAAWIDAGARLIGGCCGTDPDDLSALCRAVGSLPGGA